jgi:hypothetical protein
MERLDGGEGGCQGQIGVVKPDHGISWCTASTLDVPWKMAVVAILGCLASASILFVPLRWLSPACLMRSIAARYRSSSRRLEFCWEFGKMTPAARAETARHLLRLWQQNLIYFQATDYLQAVWERAREAEKKGNAIDVGDLPVP